MPSTTPSYAFLLLWCPHQRSARAPLCSAPDADGIVDNAEVIRVPFTASSRGSETAFLETARRMLVSETRGPPETVAEFDFATS